MGLQEVMLARMKQSHGLSRPHAGSFARREQLPALPGTIRDAYALKQQRLAPASARPSYKPPPPRRRRRAAVDEREDTILKPRRASTGASAWPRRGARRCPRRDGSPKRRGSSRQGGATSRASSRRDGGRSNLAGSQRA